MGPSPHLEILLREKCVLPLLQVFEEVSQVFLFLLLCKEKSDRTTHAVLVVHEHGAQLQIITRHVVGGINAETP